MFKLLKIMGNCLVTKLKGVVDNDNLLKLGDFLVTFRQGPESDVWASINNGLSVANGGWEIVSENGSFGTSGGESLGRSLPGGNKHVLVKGTANGPVVVKYKDIYSLTKWDFSQGAEFDPILFDITTPANQRCYMEGVHSAVTTGQFKKVSTNFNEIYVFNSWITGDLDDFLTDDKTALIKSALVTLRINNTPRLTKRLSTIQKLQELGVTVVYDLDAGYIDDVNV